jgi:predicted secreted protein
MPAKQGGTNMTEIKYQVVEHDGGWAYKVGDVFSETFPSHKLATLAAEQAAQRQAQAGRTEAITYQDAEGRWHEEIARGDDRPATDVAP